MPVINTNLSANTTLRYLNENSSMQSSSLAKISSGKRIERASDDAAGLAVSTSLRSEISILEQASINADQGISVLQTADGALARMDDVLQRMSALAAQSINGGVNDATRDFIDAEFQQLVGELDDIAGSTAFNGASLLSGLYNEEFLLGTDGSTSGADSNRLSIEMGDFRTAGLQGFATERSAGNNALGGAGGNDYSDGNRLLASLDVGGLAVIDPTAADLVFFTGTDVDGDGSVTVADSDFRQVTIDLDGTAAGVQYTYIEFDGSAAGNTRVVVSDQDPLTAAGSTVNDLLDAINGSGVVTAGVDSNGGLVIKAAEAGKFMSQVGLNGLGDTQFTDTGDVTVAAADDGEAGNLASPGSIADADSDNATGDYISVDTVDNAEIAANIVDGSISIVAEARANIGAQISRFEFRSDVINTSVENIKAANSAILDADIAEEQTEFVTYQTLTQAAVAALSKANQLPQELLRLLQ